MSGFLWVTVKTGYGKYMSESEPIKPDGYCFLPENILVGSILVLDLTPNRVITYRVSSRVVFCSVMVVARGNKKELKRV